MHKSLVPAVIAALTVFSTGAVAQPSATAEIAAIRSEIAALVARLDTLERASAGPATPAATPGATPSVPAAALAAPAAPEAAATQVVASAGPTIKFAGDLRYRHESINEEGETERQRQRLRARFGVTADVAENVRLGLQLASGGDDPVSANQTLDTGFTRKPIGIDRAFFSWAATDNLSFTGGKMANPFFRPGTHHLIYDNDLNPEGLALRYSRGDWFANYAGFWVEERAAADDSIMLGGQFGYRSTLDNGMRITAGASYYDYLNTQGQTPFWDGAGRGNSLTAGSYTHDYNLTELFTEVGLKAGEHPVTVFADYVVNSEVSAADTGYALGGSFGEVSGQGTWRLGYIYQDLEADAVIGLFTDSDFAGGGTDGKGHVVEFNYGFKDRLVFGLRYFLNERGANLGDEPDERASRGAQ